MKKAKYIVFEGTEGCGKTTYTHMLVDYLTGRGYSVLQTKEPGTSHSPLTMKLRQIILDNNYDAELTTTARELICQAIRSIHLEKVVMPALQEYDFVIQDRGILSALAYGKACGNTDLFLTQLVGQVVAPTGKNPYSLYDRVIYLKADAAHGLVRAKASKQEFAAGDAMEARGAQFMDNVANNMDEMVKAFNHCIVHVDGKTIEQVFKEILIKLGV